MTWTSRPVTTVPHRYTKIHILLAVCSGVTEKDCVEFLETKPESKVEIEMEDDKVDAMDLLDEL